MIYAKVCIGIVLVCLGIHFGLGTLAGLIIFGAGLGFMFLPIP
jgi:hypothetical protein